jgi:hypothetical protein
MRRIHTGLSRAEPDARNAMHRMKTLAALGLVASWLVQLGSAAAADSSTGVAAPEVTIDQEEQMVPLRAALRMTARQVDLTVAFAVKTASAVAHATIVTPPFHWRGEADPYPDRQYPELRVLLDGHPVAMESGFAASAGAVDLSSVMRTARIDPFQIAESPPIADVAGIAPEILDILKRSGAIARDDEAGYLAKWTAHRTIRVEVPSGSERQLTIRYTARPAFALRSLEDAARARMLDQYCLTPARVGGVLGPKDAAAQVVFNQYAISTGVNGKATPAVQVEINALTDGGQPVSLFALCDQHGNGIVETRAARLYARTDEHGVVRILAIRRPLSSGSNN